LFLAILIFAGFREGAIATSYSLGIVGMLVLAYLVCRYKISEIFKKSYLDRKEKGKLRADLMKYSLPLLFFGIVSTIFYWIDSFSLGYIKSALEVGFYNAAVPIAMLLSMAPALFIQLFFPLINRYYAKKDIYTIKELSKQVGKWIFIINLPALILVLLFPGAVIKILFGAQYLVAENALRFLAIGAFVSSIFLVSNQLISMIGKTRLILYDIVAASIINFILNIILIPLPKILFLDNSLGLVGASVATMISLLFFSALLLFQARHYLSIVPLRRKMLLISIVSIIPTALLFYVKTLVEINLTSIIILSAAFLALYLALIIITGGLDRNDWMIAKAIKNKVLKDMFNEISVLLRDPVGFPQNYP
jgi:O-antigen/teichoic acid export membrane protein